MRYVSAAAMLCLLAIPTFADEPLPSRPLAPLYVGLFNVQPVSFDLIDLRAEERQLPPPHAEIEPHSIFTIKQHLGIAAGYDNGATHGAVGLYVTIAEWGRWNFGMPAPELGFGRYATFDYVRGTWAMKENLGLFISLASVHYRVGYVRALGANCYINLEQIFDTRQNMAGSQIGLSFSPK